MNIILKALHKEANDLEKKLAAVRGAISALLGSKGTTTKRKLSKEARLKISAAQKARWAKVRKSKSVKKTA